MALEAVLTVGWPEFSPGDPVSAKTIHEACEESKEERYSGELVKRLGALSSGAQPIIIKGDDQLFRRRTRGFKDIKVFAGKLNQVLAKHGDLGDVHLEIDAFAYAFLKGAKNFDFFLPETPAKSGPYRDVLSEWNAQIEALETFERDGIASPSIDTKAYLALRRIVARKSARDELRALASLLMSGPSTQEEVGKDLGLAYGLAERILPTLQEIEVLEFREDGRYAVRKEALPRVVFCLREVMGLDLLPVLEREA